MLNINNTLKYMPVILISVFVTQLSLKAYSAETSDKVAVLITAWGQPNRYVFEYSWDNHYWARIGDTTPLDEEGQPVEGCTIGHVGGVSTDDYGDPISQLSHLGLMPWSLNHPWPGSEYTYDRAGFYKYDNETGMYLSIHPDAPALDPADIPAAAIIKPAWKVSDFMTGTLQFPLDPRTGEDLMSGWYKIEEFSAEDSRFKNGLGDAYELNNMLFMYYYKIMGMPVEPWQAADMDEVHFFIEEKMAATKMMLEEAFGDQIDVRAGYYTAVPGYTKHELEVTEEFVQEGFRKILVSRETTDNNNYANQFMVVNYVKERLCELDVLDETELHMTRQIGRTPEFNAMNIMLVRPYIEAYPEGSTIAMVYVTHGLSWPGKETLGFMGVQHPWWKEVIHENSFLNYLSWKKALLEEFGDRYNLVFSRENSELLQDSFYAYGYFNADKLGGQFNTLRDAIQLAKAEQPDTIIVVPGHWHCDAQDTQYIMRNLNNLPLVPVEDMRAGKFDLTFCEDAADNATECGSSDAHEITITSSFNDLDNEFATVYYVRLRGGIERFGVYPSGEAFTDTVVQPITKRDGGTVSVTDSESEIFGAQIDIPADPYPDYPEQFTPDTAIAFNDPANTFECMWEDMDITVAHRTNPPETKEVTAFGPAVHFGPYRAVFNREATITLPYDTAVAGNAPVGVYVYNHLTEGWEEVDIASYADGHVTFKTLFLGLFMAGRAGPRVDYGSFTAAPRFRRVMLEWTTEKEIDTQGFNIYRAESPGGVYEKIHSELITAKGSPAAGASYSFVDRGLHNRTTYYYRLECVDTSGTAVNRYPVVSATPQLLFWQEN